MPKEESIKYVCDVCGKEIRGDFMTVAVDGGGPEREFYVCLPRTAAINPCGNQTRAAIFAIFGERERTL